jgi:integrase
MIVTRGDSYGVRVYRGKVGGKKVYEWAGTFKWSDHGGKQNALKLAKTLEGRSLERSSRKQGPLVSDFVDDYLEDYREAHKASSYDTAREGLARFRREFGHLRLTDAALDEIDAVQWARDHKGSVPSVITLLNLAVKRRDVPLTYNPFKGLSKKPRGRKDKTPLSAADVVELGRLARAKLRDYGPMMQALVLFAAYSGMRPGEIFALEWTDVDFEAMRIRVMRRVYRGKTALPKSNRTRTIVLTPEARDVLLTVPRDGALIFTAKAGGQLGQSLLTDYWAPIATDFGERPDKNGELDWVDFYELRHRCAYWLYVELGMPDRIVAVQLGHTDGGKLIRELYGHGDHGALEEIDRYFATSNVAPLKAVSA